MLNSSCTGCLSQSADVRQEQDLIRSRKGTHAECAQLKAGNAAEQINSNDTAIVAAGELEAVDDPPRALLDGWGSNSFVGSTEFFIIWNNINFFYQLRMPGADVRAVYECSNDCNK